MNEQIYRHIGWNVMQLRYAKGHNQTAMGKLVGLSRQQIGRVEAGLGEVAFDNLIKLANFFDVPVATLCEEPPKFYEIDFRERTTTREKEDVKYARRFANSSPIKIVSLKSNKIRRIKIQKEAITELIVIHGEALISCEEFSQNLPAGGCLSMKGAGTVRLRSPAKYPESRLLLIQTAID
jgi:transcriptional regulator with XRE-family HTH domain